MQVRNGLSRVVEHIGLDKTGDVWDTVVHIVGRDAMMMEVTSIVAIYKERGSDDVHSRHIARHFPTLRPWGATFTACGTKGCSRKWQDFTVKSKELDVRIQCMACRWKSAWVKEKDIRNVLFKIDKTLPKIFWHHHPPTPALKNLFVDVTKSKETEAESKKGG